MINLFVLCSGQEDNIGDVVLRRRMLAALRPIGRLHVFLGQSSSEFREGLALEPGDTIYDEKRLWRRALWRSIAHGTASLIDKPGELLLDWRHFAAQVRLAPAAIFIRARGGKVYRLGMGVRTSRALYDRLYRPLLATSNVLAWRDSVSRKALNLGEVMPDWGFGESSLALERTRRFIVVSYRSDRPELSDEALTGIRQVAHRLSLSLIVITQVRRDDARSRTLAARLNCDLLDWPADRSHADQESLLRDTYTQTAITLSDRLHVLIVAMSEGAIPLGLTEHYEDKIQRHFDAVGLDRIAVRVPRGSSKDVIDCVTDSAARGPETVAALQGARNAINLVQRQIEEQSTAARSTAAHG